MKTMNEQQATSEAVQAVLNKFFSTGAPADSIKAIHVSAKTYEHLGTRHIYANLEADLHIGASRTVIKP